MIVVILTFMVCNVPAKVVQVCVLTYFGENALIYIDSLEHKSSISRNQFFSGNDFKDFASFNSCFYHLDIAFVK